MSLRRAWAGVGEAFPSSLSPETWFELVRPSGCQSWRCGRLPLPARAAASPSLATGARGAHRAVGRLPPGLGAAGERRRRRRRQSWVSESFVLSCRWDPCPAPGGPGRTRAGRGGCATCGCHRSWVQAAAAPGLARLGSAPVRAKAPTGLAGHRGGGRAPGRARCPLLPGSARAQPRDWMSLLFLLTLQGWDREPPQRPQREEGALRGSGGSGVTWGRCQCHLSHPTCGW